MVRAEDSYTRPPRLKWWFEVAFAGTFYAVYTSIRNQFGSAAVSPSRALTNAQRVIDLEGSMGLYHEATIQDWFDSADAFLRFWNIYYGSLHFIVTLGVMVWLYRRHPKRYRQWRATLASMTGLALIGFATFPLMPPRLLGDCGPYGGCQPGHDFVDTLADVGGLWSFDSGTMQEISNQYAAMPSLHVGWSTWCLLAVYPVLRSRLSRAAMIVYPLGTVFGIVVTANHYWIDAVGGLIVLAAGYGLGTWVLARIDIVRARMPATPVEEVESLVSSPAVAGAVEPPEN